MILKTARETLQKVLKNKQESSEKKNPTAVVHREPIIKGELMMAQRHISETNPAQWTFERIKKYITDFESELDNNHEIGISLVTFGSSVFHICSIGYFEPDIISFLGFNENEEKVQLIQHISQLNVLLMASKKMNENAIRIGFHT